MYKIILTFKTDFKSIFNYDKANRQDFVDLLQDNKLNYRSQVKNYKKFVNLNAQAPFMSESILKERWGYESQNI